MGGADPALPRGTPTAGKSCPTGLRNSPVGGRWNAFGRPAWSGRTRPETLGMTQLGYSQIRGTTPDVRRNGTAPAPHEGRVRVAGKSLGRRGRPFRAQGVTYGPFAPDAAGQTFPAP